MNWLAPHSADLIERTEPAEALADLRQHGVLTPAEAAKIGVYLHHWTLLLLQRPSDPEGVQELLTLCEIAQDLLPPEAQAQAPRWQAHADLLEGKRRQLLAQREARPLKHQDRILDAIRQAGGRLKQTELGVHLGLSKGRISQLLGLLEERGVVTRRLEGNEYWVSAMDAAVPAAATQPARHLLVGRVFGWAA